MSKQTGPQGGLDAATHAAVTGGEVRCGPSTQEADALAKRLKGVDWRPGCLMEQSARALRTLANERDALRNRPTAEAEAWRDGWRAAMACAVLVAETARAPAAVDLLREQLEPPV